MNTRKLLVSVLMLVSVMLSACAPATATPAPTTVPPTTAPTAVPTTVPPTTAPTIAPTQAGTMFTPKLVKIPMSLSFGSDWHVDDDFPDMFTIHTSTSLSLSFYVVTDAYLADPVDGHLISFPEDFLSWIKSNPDFDAIESTPVTVAGIEGLQVDATPIWKSTTTKLKLFLSLSGNGSGNEAHGWADGENIVTDPEQWRFILLDNVNGERLLIVLIDERNNLKEKVKQAQKVLDTVVFSKP